MPLISDLQLDALKADDVKDLLHHIAWTDVIQPALLKQREAYTKQLVSSTLGTPIEGQTSMGNSYVVSPEQLAGRISGIDFILDLFTKILSRGDHALDALRKMNINL